MSRLTTNEIRCPACGAVNIAGLLPWNHRVECEFYAAMPPIGSTTPETFDYQLGYKPSPQTASGKELGTKLDTSKPRMDLLDAYAMQQLAAVLTFGAAKYAPNNWRKGIQSSRLLAAALRHIFAYLGGQKLDPESGFSHLAHAMCCLMFAINLAETKPELSDHNQTTS